MFNLVKSRVSGRNSTFNPWAIKAEKILRPILMMMLVLVVADVNAQDLADGQAAIEEAADGIEGYFEAIQTLVVRLVTL